MMSPLLPRGIGVGESCRLPSPHRHNIGASSARDLRYYYDVVIFAIRERDER